MQMPIDLLLDDDLEQMDEHEKIRLQIDLSELLIHRVDYLLTDLEVKERIDEHCVFLPDMIIDIRS